MRAWLCVAAAALALALSSLPAAADAESARLVHIKRQILAKLGLHTRPTPVRAMPRDVVRQILERAADPEPPPAVTEHLTTREIIAIATRVSLQFTSEGYEGLISVHIKNVYLH